MNVTRPTQPMITERAWLWHLAVAFVLGTLLALVIVPWAVQRRVDRLRDEIDLAEPARTLVTRWQYNLVRQLAAIDEQILTGDTAELQTYRFAIRREAEITSRLEPLAQQIGPRVLRQFATAQTLARHWHARVREEDMFRYGAIGTPLSEVPRELDLFEQVLGSVAAIDTTIAREVDIKLTRIRSAERTGLALTFLLGALALLAAGTVIAIQGRVRQYAAEAERRRAQAAAALAEVSESEAARSKLLRGITHDVKNPLGAAKGYIEILNLGVKAPVAKEQQPLLAGAERSIDSALAIIDDLLEVSQSDKGAISVNRVQTDANEIAQAAVSEFTAAARAAGHSIEIVPATEPLNVVTDPARVRQVLENLVSNAIKYTPPPGSITVRVEGVSGEGAPGPGSWAAIKVSDTGPGIPPDKREAVFEEYTRLQEDSAKGHGLGLAIARSIARRLGGDVTIADSEIGATFVLWLPASENGER